MSAGASAFARAERRAAPSGPHPLGGSADVLVGRGAVMKHLLVMAAGPAALDPGLAVAPRCSRRLEA